MNDDLIRVKVLAARGRSCMAGTCWVGVVVGIEDIGVCGGKTEKYLPAEFRVIEYPCPLILEIWLSCAGVGRAASKGILKLNIFPPSPCNPILPF